MPHALLTTQTQQLLHLQQRLSESVQAWCADWDFSHPIAYSVDPMGAYDVEPVADRWRMLSPEQAYLGAVSHSSIEAATFALAFPEHNQALSKPSPVANVYAHGAANDLAYRLQQLLKQGLPAHPNQPDESAHAIPYFWRSRWSGAAIAKMTWAKASLSLCISPELLSYLAPAKSTMMQTKLTPQTLVSLTTALAESPISYRVELSPQPVSLDDLISMQIGDVLTTQHALDQPVLLCDELGHVALCGDLGQVSDHYAVVVSPVKLPAS